MAWLQKPVAAFGARTIRNFEINQFCPEASAILAPGAALEQLRVEKSSVARNLHRCRGRELRPFETAN
jgi:hypothetical protein